MIFYPTIYFQRNLVDDNEKKAAACYFPVVIRRTDIPDGSLVIPRYSALPNNKELEEDIKNFGSKLINSHTEHVYVADLKNWYSHLEGLTPRTWFALDQIPDQGPFVLKGATNSKKNQWHTCMFAETKQKAIDVFVRLTEDGYIGGEQPIYVREYIQLKKLCDPVSSWSAPISEEYRFFVLDGQILIGGFYWEGYLDIIEERVDPSFVPQDFLQEVIDRVKDSIRFFVVDVARTQEGKWIVIELNDGAQAGLSAIKPQLFYERLAKRIYEAMP